MKSEIKICDLETAGFSIEGRIESREWLDALIAILKIWGDNNWPSPERASHDRLD
jgi:hypothetical protein